MNCPKCGTPAVIYGGTGRSGIRNGVPYNENTGQRFSCGSHTWNVDLSGKVTENFMVIADLHPKAPVAVVRTKLPIRVQGIRNAAGPALGEPVWINMTPTQAKWLIKRLQEVIEEVQ